MLALARVDIYRFARGCIRLRHVLLKNRKAAINGLNRREAR
jgi:hypothetical protein